MSDSSREVKVEIWIPKRSSERIETIRNELVNITDAPVETEKTESQVKLDTVAPSFEECSEIEVWLPGEFPDHEKWLDSSDDQFTLRISPYPPDPDEILSTDELDDLVD